MIRPQAMIAEDPTFVAEVEELIIEESVNVEAAVAEVIRRFEKIMDSMEDQYLRERSTDVRDVGRRIISKLLFVEGDISPELEKPAIVVSTHLVPSLTVHLERDKILGFATEKGGNTSHAAILARSLDIPAVSGLHEFTRRISPEDLLIIDGKEGIVIINPDEETEKNYRRHLEEHISERKRVAQVASQPGITTDGTKIKIQGNIGRPADLQQAVKYKTDGIGLYRTEFSFMSHSKLPNEEALAEEYITAAKAFPDQGVALRILDIGGDKFPPAIPLAHEENPFIGMRGLRLMLQHAEDLLLPQMKAIIRASKAGKISILYPMVASIEDLEAAKELFQKAREQVEADGHEVREDIEQGIMIEVPSCLPMLQDILEECDFATVGTNDLIQYVLAADRNSERMSDAYNPYHPAILRMLNTICTTADELNKPISICGEMASDLTMLPLLLGMGYRCLSLNIAAVPYVRQAIRTLDLKACKTLSEKVMPLTHEDDIKSTLESFSNNNPS
jgi:phosphotransferase system enzyme I (PtsI)